ncbi:MAG: hypothetical protein MUO26_12015 [Methanotrichaceae archaeon]|nr:hypothetical protein [Methanotrichaceae archaeon]
MLKLSFNLADAISDPIKFQDLVDDYNRRIDEVPKILKLLLGSERVNIKISLNNGNFLRLGYETEHARIKRVVDSGLTNPTIAVEATERAIAQIEGSNDPIAAFQRERNLGRVVIKGKTLSTKVKLDAVLSSNTVLRFFCSIFFT